MLQGIGLERSEVYIANIVKCRPPGNRDPQPDEIEACTPWLVEQISLIQPRVVVTLGNFATKFVLNTSTGITRLRGQVHDWHGRTVIPTFHPAAILHGGGEKSRQFQLLKDDFALVGARHRSREAGSPPGSPTRSPETSTGARRRGSPNVIVPVPETAAGGRPAGAVLSAGRASGGDGRGHPRASVRRCRRRCGRATPSC